MTAKLDGHVQMTTIVINSIHNACCIFWDDTGRVFSKPNDP